MVNSRHFKQILVDYFSYPVISGFFFPLCLARWSILIWFLVLPLSQHDLPLVLCCALSLLVIRKLFLIKLFWTTIRSLSSKILRSTRVMADFNFTASYFHCIGFILYSFADKQLRGFVLHISNLLTLNNWS